MSNQISIEGQFYKPNRSLTDDDFFKLLKKIKEEYNIIFVGTTTEFDDTLEPTGNKSHINMNN